MLSELQLLAVGRQRLKILSEALAALMRSAPKDAMNSPLSPDDDTMRTARDIACRWPGISHATKRLTRQIDGKSLQTREDLLWALDLAIQGLREEMSVVDKALERALEQGGFRRREQPPMAGAPLSSPTMGAAATGGGVVDAIFRGFANLLGRREKKRQEAEKSPGAPLPAAPTGGEPSSRRSEAAQMTGNSLPPIPPGDAPLDQRNEEALQQVMFWTTKRFADVPGKYFIPPSERRWSGDADAFDEGLTRSAGPGLDIGTKPPFIDDCSPASAAPPSEPAPPKPRGHGGHRDTVRISVPEPVPDELRRSYEAVEEEALQSLRVSGLSPRVEPPRVSQARFSALAPKRFERGGYSMVDVVMYEEEWRSAVEQVAAEYDEPLKETASGFMEVGDGATVRVTLSSPDLKLDDCDEAQKWLGRWLRFSFAVALPEDYPKRQILFIAQVYIDDVPATRLKFIASCESPEPQRPALERRDVLSGFMSYASQDRARVAAMIQGMRKVRPELDLFFDVENLRSGENWGSRLKQEIERRDVLFLCWSRYAQASEWVEREWRYMLEIKGEEAIEPLPVEPPSLCPPPEALKHKHFSDRLLYLIDVDQNSHN